AEERFSDEVIEAKSWEGAWGVRGLAPSSGIESIALPGGRLPTGALPAGRARPLHGLIPRPRRFPDWRCTPAPRPACPPRRRQRGLADRTGRAARCRRNARTSAANGLSC